MLWPWHLHSSPKGGIWRGVLFSFPTSNIPGHAFHFAKSRLYHPNHSDVVHKKESQRMPVLGTASTSFATSKSCEWHRKAALMLKAVKIDWDYICKVAIFFSWTLDLFQACHSNVGRNTRVWNFAVGQEFLGTVCSSAMWRGYTGYRNVWCGICSAQWTGFDVTLSVLSLITPHRFWKEISSWTLWR